MMSNGDPYLSWLPATKIYKEQLVTTHTTQRFKLSSLPKADPRRHILIMEMRGSDPNLYTVLTESRPTLSIGEAWLNKYLCVLVDMTQRSLTISNKYYLKNSRTDHLKVTITLEYKVANAETLFIKNRDSLTLLELLVASTAKQYFDQVSSTDFDIATLQTDLKAKVNEAVDNTSQTLGLQVMDVFVTVELPAA
jgi:hypothetical protein